MTTETGFLPAHEVIGDGARVAFVIHGILGSGQNWRMYTRKLAEVLPGWRFVLVDLRNHGASDGAPPPHTLVACAADLRRLGEHLGQAPAAVIGHSFGGKVALVYARDHGEATGLEQVWALDILPGAADPQRAMLTSDVVRVIAALREIELPIARRRDLVDVLKARGFSDLLSRWMTTNLVPDPQGGREAGFVWAFDLDGVEAMLADYLGTDVWPFIERVPHGMQAHLVRGGRSERWSDEAVARLRAAGARVHLHELPEAGHWVHVDSPDELRAMLVESLRG